MKTSNGDITASLYNSSDPSIMTTLYPGSDHVRLVMDWYNPVTSTDTWDPTAATRGYMLSQWIEYMDDAVKWVTGSGLYLVISLRVGYGFKSTSGTMKPANVLCNLTIPANATMLAQYKVLWSFIANRYKSVDRMGFYELASEPHLGAGRCTADNGTIVPDVNTRQDVVAIFKTVADLIHTIDPNILVAAAPEYNPAAGAMDLSFKINSSKIVYPVNLFAPAIFSYLFSPSVLTQGVTDAGPFKVCGDFFPKGTMNLLPECQNSKGKADASIAYNFTAQWKASLTELLSKVKTFRTTYNVPIWLDQIGTDHRQPYVEAWMQITFEVVKEVGVEQWNWWTFKGVSPMGVDIPPASCTKKTCQLDMSGYMPSPVFEPDLAPFIKPANSSEIIHALAVPELTCAGGAGGFSSPPPSRPPPPPPPPYPTSGVGGCPTDHTANEAAALCVASYGYDFAGDDTKCKGAKVLFNQGSALDINDKLPACREACDNNTSCVAVQIFFKVVGQGTEKNGFSCSTLSACKSTFTKSGFGVFFKVDSKLRQGALLLRDDETQTAAATP